MEPEKMVRELWDRMRARIVHGREHWTMPGSDPSPAWRAAYRQPR